jgi:hypothetical protein
VAANTGAARTGTMTIAGQNFTVIQCANIDIGGNYNHTVQAVGTWTADGYTTPPFNVSYAGVKTTPQEEFTCTIISGNWEEEYSVDCGIGPGSQHLKQQLSYTIEGNIIRASDNIIFDGDCYVNGCIPGYFPCHIWWYTEILLSGEGTAENNAINFVLTGTGTATTTYFCSDLTGCFSGFCTFTESLTFTCLSSSTSLETPKKGGH